MGARVSVIVAAYRSGRTLEACLSALEAQSHQDFEVILVDSTPGDDRALEMARSFTRVHAYHHPERLLPHQARNQGLTQARGDILAFTDADCMAHPDWLKFLVMAHEQGHPVVGGAVQPLAGFWNWAVHFTKYGWWLPGAKPGARTEIPSANASYHRDVLERAGQFVGERFAGDSELSWRARALGFPIWFEPRAVVTHDHPQPLSGFSAERYRRGRDFGLTRIESRHWSRRRSALQLMLFPLLPLLMVMRNARYAFSAKQMPRFLLTAPVQLIGHLCWCVGEARSNWGLLWGR